MNKILRKAGLIVLAALLILPLCSTAQAQSVIRMQPASWASAGFWYNNLVYMAEYVNEHSKGSIVIEPSQPGAICPVSEQMDMVSKGITPAMAPPAGYYAGKIPVGLVWPTPPLVRTIADMREINETFEGGRAGKIWDEAVEARYNVKVLGHMYGQADCVFMMTTPINSLDEMKGQKLRIGAGYISKTLEKFGGAPVFSPPQEVYTMLSNKAIDGAVNGSPYDNMMNSFQEVTKYWIKLPTTNWVHATTFIINRGIWNKMTPEQQQIMKDGLEYANQKTAEVGNPLLEQAWKDFAAAGGTAIEWPVEDQRRWEKALYDTAVEASTDPGLKEYMDILNRWGQSKGYL